MPALPIVEWREGTNELVSREQAVQRNNVFDLLKRDTPKINGSSGGFIALIVCLSFIIVISCTAIFFLLRNREPSDADRAARRQRRRYVHQSVPSSSSYAYDPSSTPSKKGWLSSLFSFDSSKASRKGGEGMARGWVQAGSGDEWDPSEDVMADENMRSRSTVAVSHTKSIPGTSYIGIGVDEPFHPPPPPPRMTTADSVQSVHFDTHAVTGLDRSMSPSPMPSPPQLTSPIPRHSVSLSEDIQSSLPRSLSPEPIEADGKEDTPVDKRKWSVQSDASTKTFAGGTKFIEGL